MFPNKKPFPWNLRNFKPKKVINLEFKKPKLDKVFVQKKLLERIVIDHPRPKKHSKVSLV